MTDTDTTLAGEVAAAVRILRDISETLRSIDTSPICHDPHDYGQPLNPREATQQPRGDTFTPDPPTREGDTVDAPQKPAHEFQVGDRVRILPPGTAADGFEGSASEHVGEIATVVDPAGSDGDLWVWGIGWYSWVSAALAEPVDEEPAPVEWPIGPGLYWARGVDAGDPVEGFAILDDEAPRRVLAFVRDHSICEDEADDRLDEAVPLTAVPTRLVDHLRGVIAVEAPDREIKIAGETIVRWLDDHEDGAR